MKFILGQKEKMTQLFDESGKVIPGTIISAGPVYVLDVKKVGDKPRSVKTPRGNYDSVIIGYKDRRLKNLNKPQQGLVKKALAEREKGFSFIKEFNNKKSVLPTIEIGQTIDVSAFVEGDKVTVSAITKGKGFQGVVKRHGFKGGRRSHGQKHSEREPGSIGVGGQQRVMPGRRMGGRMGGERMTFKNLTIARIDKENNRLFIKGAIPGRKGTLVEIVSK
ncbi:MAG: 50S ribosomal protein L3 [Candidatus Paceibacterota bacterium]